MGNWFTRGSWNPVARFDIYGYDSPENDRSRHCISFQFAGSIDRLSFIIENGVTEKTISTGEI